MSLANDDFSIPLTCDEKPGSPYRSDLVFKGRHLGAPFSCSPALNLICWWCTAGNPACPRGLFSGVYGGPSGVIETPLESFWALL